MLTSVRKRQKTHTTTSENKKREHIKWKWKSKNGHIFSDKKEILSRWMEHNIELLRTDNQEAEEIRIATKIKNHKSSGKDTMTTDLLKTGEQMLTKTILQIIMNVWQVKNYRRLERWIAVTIERLPY